MSYIYSVRQNILILKKESNGTGLVLGADTYSELRHRERKSQIGASLLKVMAYYSHNFHTQGHERPLNGFSDRSCPVWKHLNWFCFSTHLFMFSL